MSFKNLGGPQRHVHHVSNLFVMDCSLCQHVPIASSCLSFLNFWISCGFKKSFTDVTPKIIFRTLLIAGVAVSSVTSLGISKKHTQLASTGG